jgi:antitoxin (DNA-binding transcriptional repressor) of toxin-antitoxin stability system
MNTVSIQDLQRDPLAVLSRVTGGESLLVVHEDRPLAELRPPKPARAEPRPYGLAAGAFTVPDDFDAPLPEDILQDFGG